MTRGRIRTDSHLETPGGIIDDDPLALDKPNQSSNASFSARLSRLATLDINASVRRSDLIFAILLHAADMALDIYVVHSLVEEDQKVWTAAALTFIVLPIIVNVLHAFYAEDWQLMVAHLTIIGYPVLTLYREWNHQATYEQFYIKSPNTQTIRLIEGICESLPQAVLQLYIILNKFRIDWLFGCSLTLSFINVSYSIWMFRLSRYGFWQLSEYHIQIDYFGKFILALFGFFESCLFVVCSAMFMVTTKRYAWIALGLEMFFMYIWMTHWDDTVDTDHYRGKLRTKDRLAYTALWLGNLVGLFNNRRDFVRLMTHRNFFLKSFIQIVELCFCFSVHRPPDGGDRGGLCWSIDYGWCDTRDPRDFNLMYLLGTVGCFIGKFLCYYLIFWTDHIADRIAITKWYRTDLYLFRDTAKLEKEKKHKAPKHSGDDAPTKLRALQLSQIANNDSAITHNSEIEVNSSYIEVHDGGEERSQTGSTFQNMKLGQEVPNEDSQTQAEGENNVSEIESNNAKREALTLGGSDAETPSAPPGFPRGASNSIPTNQVQQNSPRKRDSLNSSYDDVLME